MSTSENRTSPVFKWFKAVQSSNGLDFKQSSSNRTSEQKWETSKSQTLTIFCTIPQVSRLGPFENQAIRHPVFRYSLNLCILRNCEKELQILQICKKTTSCRVLFFIWFMIPLSEYQIICTLYFNSWTNPNYFTMFFKATPKCSF